MFQISEHPIDPIQLKETLLSAHAGAYVSFEGWVRDHNNDRPVQSLQYQTYVPLCEKEAQIIFDEAKQQFNVVHMACVHREGHLKIGDLAVWVGVVAAHRDEAYQASRYIIDQIKLRLPIWKKEHYTDGQTEWVNCSAEAQSKIVKESQFYARQMNLPALGLEGQEQLKQARVLVIGAGGLGSAVLSNLAGAGIGVIGICEYDTLDASNLHRQHLYSFSDVGKPKVDLAARRIAELNPFITVIKHPVALTAGNAMTLFQDYDYICDCTDNFKTKFIIHDACYFLNKILIQASIYQQEGQLSVMSPDYPGCLRCLWPQVPEAGCVGTCTEVGVLGTLPSLFGTLQAHQVIQLVLNLGNDLSGKTLFYDMLNQSQRIVRNPHKRDCPLCGENPKIKGITMSQYENNRDEAIDVEDLQHFDIAQCVFMDIREPFEVMMQKIDSMPVEYCPLSQFDPKAFAFEQSKQYIIYCAAGIRSLDLVRYLRAQGISNVFSLNQGVGGMKAFAEQLETGQ